MQTTSLRLLVGASLFAIAGLAQANATHDTFIDVANSVSFDGWNQLNRGRLPAALTLDELKAGTVANVAGSGDAALTLLSGSYYPAGFGLYGNGNLTFTDNTVASNITSLVFQGIINDFDASFGATPWLALWCNSQTLALRLITTSTAGI